MKKRIKLNILFKTIIYAIIFVLSSMLLDKFELTFLWWVKDLSIILVTLGIIIGIIEIIGNMTSEKKFRKLILHIVWILFVLFAALVNFIYFVFMSNSEKITKYYDVKMIIEVRSVWKSNYIKYYDYLNPFIRSKQERISEYYDDAIAIHEYGGTTFYNEEGKEVDEFNGRPYFDFSEVKKEYNSKKEYTFENVESLLNEVLKLYDKSIYDVSSSDGYLGIYFVNEEFNFEISANDKLYSKEKIDSYIKKESEKQNIKYEIELRKGMNIIKTLSCN